MGQARRPAVTRPPPDLDYDVIVVGSGFGGSVAALRLTEKGYRVAVLEAGRRFADHELPATSWHLRRWLWAPWLGCYGVQRLTLLRNVLVVAGAGVGGGSLNYANTLYTPPQAFYDDPQWRDIADWRSELAPHYDQAQRMLGVVENPTTTPADEHLRAIAIEMGVENTYGRTPVGVLFSAPGQRPGDDVDDPFFGGAGPRRRSCTECGSCMTGCRVGAKNTMVKNYLYLAERAGAVVQAETTVSGVRPLEDGAWAVSVRPSRVIARPQYRTLRAQHVVLAAGTLGTQRLLHRMRDRGVLPNLSHRLGQLSRTNSEAILVASARDRRVDYSRGIAITSSFHPDESTHMEPARYGRGSNAMGLLATLLVDGGSRVPRPIRFVATAARHPRAFARSLSVRHWSERTVIALVMQSLDNSLTVRRTRFGWLTTMQGHGPPNPTWIPVAHDVTRRLAQRMGGDPGGSVTELLDRPVTAHFIGGCAIGASARTGVVDAWHRVFGYDGLHIVDGSTVSANLGVNPALTITALAERAMSFWPNRGDVDARPCVGSRYIRVAPVAPIAPAVPEHAYAALRPSSDGTATELSGPGGGRPTASRPGG
jgi:cholesterol oxidase